MHRGSPIYAAVTAFGRTRKEAALQSVLLLATVGLSLLFSHCSVHLSMIKIARSKIARGLGLPLVQRYFVFGNCQD
jgi:ABC-type histidine transport system ATPase subunit